MLQKPIFRQVRRSVTRISRSASTISAPISSARAMARSISSPGVMLNFWAIFRWREAMMSWERRMDVRFSRITLTMSVSCHLSRCRIAS